MVECHVAINLDSMSVFAGNHCMYPQTSEQSWKKSLYLLPSHGELCVELSEVVPGRCDMAVVLLQTDLLEAPIVTGVLSLVGFSQVVSEIHL